MTFCFVYVDAVCDVIVATVYRIVRSVAPTFQALVCRLSGQPVAVRTLVVVSHYTTILTGRGTF